MDNIEELWNECKIQLLSTLPASVKKPFDALELKEYIDGNLILRVPSAFTKQLIVPYTSTIKNTLSESLGKEINVEYIVDKNQVQKRVEKQPQTVLPNQEIKNIEQKKKSTLNKTYRLDNFIAGENSDLAYEVAQLVAKNPGTSYNPVLIYGGVGLGKTHLLQAIGNYIEEHDPSKKVIYTTAESFTNEFISSLSKDFSDRNNFKKKYRKADVLLIDDIHFFEKKESTQEELFHIFNELYDNQNLIVFTCDRPISELKDITDRLKTRFSRGFNVDLKPPQYEVRMAIAKQKMKNQKIDLPYETLDFICQNVKTNVRDLEGAITTICGVARIIKKPMTVDMAKEHLVNVITPEELFASSNFSLDQIFTITSNYFNVSLMDMKGSSRSKKISDPRKVGIYIANKLGKFSQTEIGKYLNKDHTSISYVVSKFSSIIEVDESLKKSVNEIQKKLEDSIK